MNIKNKTKNEYIEKLQDYSPFSVHAALVVCQKDICKLNAGYFFLIAGIARYHGIP